MPADLPIRCLRYSLSSGWGAMDGLVIGEATVSLTVNGEVWLSFTCTPQHLDALAVGFLFNEGIIQKAEEIAAIDVCPKGSNVDVWLRRSVPRPTEWLRTSGCTGGVTTVHSMVSSPIETKNEQISPEALLSLMDQLLESQELYHEAHGVHCSALSDGQKLHLTAEDIGRHNTLDKLAGRVLLENIRISPVIVLTTGRVSSEMLQKSARLSALAVVSRTSPTSMSVAMADSLGITLVGYARRSGFTVYTHPERLFESEAVPSQL